MIFCANADCSALASYLDVTPWRWRRFFYSPTKTGTAADHEIFVTYLNGWINKDRIIKVCCIWFSLLVLSDSLWPHGQQHAWLPCPLPPPRVCSSSCPLSRWCHPAISSSAAPCSFCLQSFPASGSFPTGWLFTSSGRSIGASASASVLPMNIQSWFPLGLTGLILLSQGLQESFPALQLESINSLVLCLLYGPALTLVHDYRKNHSFGYMNFCQQSDASAF